MSDDSHSMMKIMQHHQRKHVVAAAAINPTSTTPSSSTLTKSSTLVLITMAALLSLSLISIILYFSLTAAAATHRNHHHITHPPPSSLTTATVQIHQACQSTRYAHICESSLLQSNRLPPNPTPFQIIQASVFISADNLDAAQSMVASILNSSADNLNRSTAAKNCIEALTNSKYRAFLTTNTAADMSSSRARIKDARAWMSAALLFQYDCWSGLKYANDTHQVNQTMSFLMNSLITSTSNALSMIMAYNVHGDDTASWKPPETERNGFWEGGGGSGDGGFRGGGVPPRQLWPDVTVCSEGCDYMTVQSAVNAVPDSLTGKKFVIKIKEGVYDEIVRVPLQKQNVVFLGDGIGKTVITGSLFSGQPGITTSNSATVGVTGDGFMASGLTFQNTAGLDAHQAVAFRSDSDLSIIENCEFLGNQDTLYAHSLRQFYKSCSIQGNVDFIFGNSASFFQDCTILVRPRQSNPEKGENNAITAHGRTDPAQTTGFVFQNCLINGTEDYMALYYSKPKVHKTFLGRPWKEYSRTVFIHCNLEALVMAQGWMPWSGDFALQTLYYGEFENSGTGADVTQRVAWSSQVPSEHVLSYSVESFIQGDEWIPSSLMDS